MPPSTANVEPDARLNQVPRVFLACLCCYNSGQLVSDWFPADDCPQDSQELATSGVSSPAVHFAQGHDELWCLDIDGFDGALTDECPPTRARGLAALVEASDELGIPREALAYWVRDGHDSDDEGELLDALRDAYCSGYDDGAAYAEELANDRRMLPTGAGWPISCINWAHAWRELEIGRDKFAIHTASGTHLIFCEA